MHHLELHVLQSFPVACLNRDDLGSPKTAVFGGIQRARVSSQCWKRAIRRHAKEELPGSFGGVRTKLLVQMFKDELTRQGENESNAGKLAGNLADALANLEKAAPEDGADKKGRGKAKSRGTTESEADSGSTIRVKTLTYIAPAEVQRLCEIARTDQDCKKALKSLAKKSGAFGDAADIALFGRMVANEPSLTLEGAAVFSHALSTHKVDNEIDFYTAVDDRQEKEDAGAGMMGSLEFNSATYYRFVGVNLDLLDRPSHLGVLDKTKRREVLEAFIRSSLLALPTGRQNSMNAATLPSCVLGVVRKKGHPIQLINAFEKPAHREDGKSILEKSEESLMEHYKSLKKTWGLDAQVEAWMPELDLEKFVDQVAEHA